MSTDADQSNPLKERGGWVRWLVLAVGVGFLLPVASNLAARDWANVGAGMGVAVVGIGSFLLMTWNRRGRLGLLEWVGRHREDIRAGVASFEGRPVRLDTKVWTCRTGVSFLVVSCWFASRFVLEGERDAGLVKWSSTLATLLLGWWGIPFGPVFTIRALYRRRRRPGHGGRSAEPDGGENWQAPRSDHLRARRQLMVQRDGLCGSLLPHEVTPCPLAYQMPV